MSTEILNIEEIIESQAGKFITHNKGLRQFEGQTTRVLSRSQSDPGILTPAPGDSYIVPVGAVAPWDTHVNEIAHWYDPAGGASPQWNYYPPVEGAQLLWVNDEDRLVIWDGTVWKIPTSLATNPAITVSSVAGVVTFDLDQSRHFTVPLTENITSIVLQNVPTSPEPFDFIVEWIQTAAYTVTWPAPYRWSGGVAPTITTTGLNADVHLYISRDGGFNIWSHELMIDGPQDALLLTNIPQYVHILTEEQAAYLGLSAFTINFNWRGGTQYGLGGPGAGDADHGAYDNTTNRAYQSTVLPARESGKFYIEFICGPFMDNAPAGAYIFGLTQHLGTYFSTSNYFAGAGAAGAGSGVGMADDGTVWSNGSNLGVLGAPFVGGDRLCLAFDLDANVAYFGVNGVWVVGDPNTETGGISWPKYTGWGHVDETWLPCFSERQTGANVSTQFSVARTTVHPRPIQFQPYADRNQRFYTPDFSGPNRKITHIGHIFQDCHFDPADNPGEYKNFANIFGATYETSLEALVNNPLGSCRLQWPAAARPGQTGTDYTGPQYNVIQPGTGKWYWLLNGGFNLDLEIGLVDLAFPIATTKPSAYLGTSGVWNNTTGSTWLNGVLQGAATPPNTGSLGTAVFVYDSDNGLMWIKSVPSNSGDATSDPPWDLGGIPDTGANPVWNLGAPVPMQIVVWLSTDNQVTYARPKLQYAENVNLAGVLGNATWTAYSPTLINAETARPLALMAY